MGSVRSETMPSQAAAGLSRAASLARSAVDAAVDREGIDTARRLLGQVCDELASVAADADLLLDLHVQVVHLRGELGAHLLAADTLTEAGSRGRAAELLARAARLVLLAPVIARPVAVARS